MSTKFTDMRILQTTLNALIAPIILFLLAKLVNSLGEGTFYKNVDLFKGTEEERSVVKKNLNKPRKTSESKLESHPDQQASPSTHDFEDKLRAIKAFLKQGEESEKGLTDSKRIAQRTKKASNQSRLPHSTLAKYSFSKQTHNGLTSDRLPSVKIMSYDEVFEKIDIAKIPYVVASFRPSDLRAVDAVDTDVHCELNRDHLYQKWSEPIVLDWQKRGLDLELMDVMSTCLNLKNKSPYIGITFPTQHHYYQVKQMWKDFSSFKDKMGRVEATIKEELGDLEFLRRINAFRLLLHRHTIAANWKILYNTRAHGPHQATNVNRKVFAFHYGLSENPQKVEDPLCTSNAQSINPKVSYDLFLGEIILQAVCGKLDAQRRLELKLYWVERLPKGKHNSAYNKVLNESGKFGLNTLTVVKVKDALQLGSSCWYDYKPKKMTIDEAFSQMLTVMTDKNSMWHWIDSPERAWLKLTYGDDYFAALKELSISISLSNFADIPLSIHALKKILGKGIKFDTDYKWGYELLWCDFGLNPRAGLMMLRNSKKPEDIEEFMKTMGKIPEEDKKLLQDWHRFLEHGSKESPSHIETFNGLKLKKIISEFCVNFMRTDVGQLIEGIKGVFKTFLD